MTEFMLGTALPDALCILGETIHIRSDFRTGIAVRELWADERLRGMESLAWKTTFGLLFPSKGNALSADLTAYGQPFLLEAMRGVLWFLSDGRMTDRMLGREPGGLASDVNRETSAVFSYRYDAPLLYAGFLRCYGIELCRNPTLHLWKFDALVRELPQDTGFQKTITCRSTPIPPDADEDVRVAMAEARLQTRIPPHAAQKSRFEVSGTIEK